MLGKKGFEMLRKDVEQALQEVAKKYEIEIKAGHISYSDTKFTLKLEAHKPEINGQSFEQAEFEKYCLLYGFSKNDYNREFMSNGKSFHLVGFKPKASKYPVIATCNEDGKRYKFPVESVKRHITA